MSYYDPSTPVFIVNKLKVDKEAIPIIKAFKCDNCGGNETKNSKCAHCGTPLIKTYTKL